MLTRGDLIADFEEIGILAGDHVAVGVSLNAIRDLENGPETFISALLQVVGPHGTVMANAYTEQSYIGRRRELPSIDTNGWKIFDPSSSLAFTGVVPNLMLARPDAVRSTHPASSVVAIGAAAEPITRPHTPVAPAYSPYSTLAELGGKYLALGIGKNLVGLRHESQNLAGLLSILPPYKGALYRDRNGQVQLFVRQDYNGCVTKLVAFVDPLIESGIIARGRIANSDDALLVDVAKYLKESTRQLAEDPSINLCESVKCLWCREIERKLKISHVAHLTVRDRVTRWMIAPVNWYRLRYNENPHKISRIWRGIRMIAVNYV